MLGQLYAVPINLICCKFEFLVCLKHDSREALWKIIYETLSVSTYLLGKVMNESKRAWGETAKPYPTFVFFFFWPRHAACRILVPQPGIEPVPTALGAQSLNHWTAREVPAYPTSVCYHSISRKNPGQIRMMPKNQCLCMLSLSLSLITYLSLNYVRPVSS